MILSKPPEYDHELRFRKRFSDIVLLLVLAATTTACCLITFSIHFDHDRMMIEKAIQRACERPVLSDTAMMKRIALGQKAAAEEIHETKAVASVGVMRTQRQIQGVDK